MAIAGGRIAGLGAYDGGERVDAGGRFLVPGFIDAHVHIESSKLTPAEFARAVVPHGTTAVVTDPHEVANVLGREGVDWMLEASEELPLDVFVMAPSCVPASHFESPVGLLAPADMEAILRHPRALGVAEMMNFPAVIAGDPDVLALARARPSTSTVTPRASPVMRSTRTSPPASAPTTRRPRSRRRSRSGGAACGCCCARRRTPATCATCCRCVARYGPEHCAFCTDDREPDFLLPRGPHRPDVPGRGRARGSRPRTRC